MVGLKNTVLMRPELLEFGFEELVFLACDGLFVEDKNIGYVVGMNLIFLSALVASI